MLRYLFFYFLTPFCFSVYAQIPDLSGKWISDTRGTHYTIYQTEDGISLDYFSEEDGYNKTSFDGKISGNMIRGRKHNIEYDFKSFKTTPNDGICVVCHNGTFSSEAYFLIEYEENGDIYGLTLYVKSIPIRGKDEDGCCEFNNYTGKYKYYWSLYRE